MRGRALVRAARLALARVLALALGPVLAATPAAAAEKPEVHSGAGVSFYADGMRTFVWTPHVDAGTSIAKGLSVEASWDLDVITSASVDVVTAATPTMNDERNVLGGTLAWAATPRLAATAGYVLSMERDFTAHTLHASIKDSLFGDRLDVSATYSVSITKAGIRKEARDLWRAATLHSAEASASLVLDRRTLVDFVYSLFYATGYLANPYRRVPVLSSGDLRDALWVEEAVPGERWRHATTLRFRRGFATRGMVTADYRFYWDDWGLRAHMAAASVVLGLPGTLVLELRGRASFQNGASFYEERYDTFTVYRTRDRRLSPHEVYLAGAALLWDAGKVGPLGSVDVRFEVDGLAWHYPRFLAPALTLVGDPLLEPLGWVPGMVAQLTLEVRL